MSLFLLILFYIFMTVFLLRPFAILLHEIGHAIPMILLSGQKATIFVGSYGDMSKSFRLMNMGLLEIYVRYNPLLLWKGGICIPAATEIPINHQIIYTLSGPVTSLLVAFAASCLAFLFDSHGAVKFVLVIFTGLALFDLFANLIPRKQTYYDVNGLLLQNDGQNIVDMLKYKKYEKTYQQAAAAYNLQEFDKAAVLFDKMILEGSMEPIIFRLAMHAHNCIGNYDKALTYSKDLEGLHTLDANDHVTIAYIKSGLNMEEESMAAYDQALLLDPSHDIALNNKGYILLAQYKYEEALPYLEKAVIAAPDKGYAFNNLGLAKIKTGNMEDGLKDILHSLELDATNGYAYRNLGIYYLDKGDKQEALKQFEIAVQKEDNIPLIDELILEARG